MINTSDTSLSDEDSNTCLKVSQNTDGVIPFAELNVIAICTDQIHNDNVSTEASLLNIFTREKSLFLSQ